MAKRVAPDTFTNANRDLSSSSLDEQRPVDLHGPVDRPFVPLGEDSRDEPIFELFAAVAARTPDAIALEDGEAELSYGAVLNQAAALAQAIARRVEPDEPVGIALPNGVKYPVAMLAALAAGRPYVPLDLTFPAELNALIVRQSAMRAVILDEATGPVLRAMGAAPPPLDYAAGIADNGGAALASSADSVARVIFTSGSEGRPKGVFNAQHTIVHEAFWRINQTHLSADDRVILLTAPAVPASQRPIFATLLTGARLVIVDLRRKGLQEAARVMARRGITVYASAPFVFRRLMEQCRDPASVATLREVRISSDRIFASDVALFRERFPADCLFSSNFASNETSVSCAWYVPRDMTLDRPLLPVGYALPGYEIRLVDADGQLVPRGEIGEIVTAGRHICEGYWRDEALTRRTFTVDPNDPKRRIFRGGDLGIMRPDGLLEIVGRKDRQLKIRGMRVEPTEVEATLRGHPAIRDAAVIPRPAGDSVDIIAYATARPDTPPPAQAELSKWLGERLPHVMRPRRVYMVDALPLLGNFKPDILALQALDRERAALETAEAVALPAARSVSGAAIAEAVRGRWQRLLGRASFDANLTWDEAGGDSLKALELVFALEDQLALPVDMAVVGPAARPSDLIAALQDLARIRAGGVRGRASPEMRLFFLPGYSGLVFHDAAFVQALARDLEIEVVEYPPVMPTRLRPVAFADIVAHAVSAIRARLKPGEPIGLLGYSFGGYVAFAAAGKLKADGIDLAWLGIVDAAAPDTGHLANDIAISPELGERAQHRGNPLSRAWTVVTRPRYAFDRLITIGIDRQDYARLAKLWRALEFLKLRRAQVRFRVQAMRLLRLRSRVRHAFERYVGPVFLVYGSDNMAWSKAGVPDDLGWSRWCGAVRTARVPGDHLGMLRDGNLDALTRMIVAQCENCASPPEKATTELGA